MRLSKDVKAALWSYDSKKINPMKHSKTIVSGVLNWGNEKATHWLFKFYGRKKVTELASQIPIGEWDKKSLALWSLVLKIKPQKRTKRILHG